MNNSNNAVVLDNYWGLTKGLSKENKIKLVARLTNEIEKDEKKEDVIDLFFGAFKSDKSAEELIAEIRESRISSRIIIPFD